MKKTIALLSLTTAMLLLLLVNVWAGGAQEKGAEKTELKWLQWWVNEWGPEKHASLIDNFEKMNPAIEVTVVDVPWPEMAGKLKTAAAGGVGYDVLGMEIDWIPSLVKLGYVEDLDPWLAKEPNFASSLTASTPWKFLGVTRGLALYLIPYQFAYNVDIFEKEGLEPPMNWEEFVQVLKKLRHDGKYGMSMPLQDASFIISRYFGFRLAQEGGQWFNADGDVIFNSPEGIASVEWWKDLYEKDLIVPGSIAEGQSTMLEFVASEQTACLIDGPFILTKAKQITPDIKIAYAPAWKAKTGGYSWASSGMAMSANSEHKDEAWKFIKYIYSDEVAIDMTKTISLPWATKVAIDSIKGSTDPMLKYVPDFMNQAPSYNVSYPIVPEADKLFDAFKLAFQEALTNKKTVSAALNEAAKIWQDAIDATK